MLIEICITDKTFTGEELQEKIKKDLVCINMDEGIMSFACDDTEVEIEMIQIMGG